MSTPKFEVDYKSKWEGYQMQYQDLEGARTRELATSKMRMSMAGLTPESENWEKSLGAVNERYDKDLSDLQQGSDYSALKEGLSKEIRTMTTPVSQNMINTREYGTHGNPEWEKAREKDAVRKADFAAGLGLKGGQLDHLAGLLTAENGKYYAGDMSSGYRQMEVTAEDRAFEMEALTTYYNNQFGNEDYTAKKPGEQALDVAKQAAAGGGQGGRKRGAGGGGGSSASPNAGESGLFTPLGGEEEEKANPWI